MTRHDLYQTQPASGLGERWRDATPLGNGLTGVLQYGGCRQEALIIQRHDLWRGAKDGEIPEISHCIPQMRKLMEAGQYEDACSYMYDALEQAGYGTLKGSMRTLAQVTLLMDCPGVYNNYRRTLHMDSGEAEISYRLGDVPYRRRSFVPGRDVTVLRGEQSYPAHAVAVNDDGTLTVRLPDGTEQILSSGEISVRV